MAVRPDIRLAQIRAAAIAHARVGAASSAAAAMDAVEAVEAGAGTASSAQQVEIDQLRQRLDDAAIP